MPAPFGWEKKGGNPFLISYYSEEGNYKHTAGTWERKTGDQAYGIMGGETSSAADIPLSVVQQMGERQFGVRPLGPDGIRAGTSMRDPTYGDGLSDRLRAENSKAAEEGVNNSAHSAVNARLLNEYYRELERNAIPWLTPGSLPVEEEAALLRTLQYLSEGTIPSDALRIKWGTEYKNLSGKLPGTARPGNYYEYRVMPSPGNTTAGSRRIVVGPDAYYYTWTHYDQNGDPAFVRIK